MDALLRELREGPDGIPEYHDTELSADALTLGSAADQQVQLLGRSIAPEHAVIRRSGQRLVIECRRGLQVRVNDRLVKSSRLAIGDVIELGGHRLTIAAPPTGFDTAIELRPNDRIDASEFEGAFRKFHVRLDLDPAKPAAGRLDVTVDTASVDTQDEERDGILRSADFFWSEKYPEASYHATHIERAGAGWRATGDLTMRGVTRPVPVTFTLSPAEAGMRGTASLKRLSFGLGQGDWASTEWVGDEVDIRFDLKLAPAG